MLGCFTPEEEIDRAYRILTIHIIPLGRPRHPCHIRAVLVPRLKLPIYEKSFKRLTTNVMEHYPEESHVRL